MNKHILFAALLAFSFAAFGYDPSNPNGQATMANSQPVVIASNQSAINVIGTFWQATQPVSLATIPLASNAATAANQVTGNGYLASLVAALTNPLPVSGTVGITGTVPISAASLPLPNNAAQETGGNLATIATNSGTQATAALQTNGNTSLSSIATNTGNAATSAATIATQTNGVAKDGTDGTGITPPSGGVGIRGWLSGIFNKLNTSIAVTGTFWQATQPVSLASLPALTAGSAIIGKVDIDQTTPGTTNNVTVSSITPPTLTKGVQGSTGFSTQEPKDAGRVSKVFYASGAAAGSNATETLLTMNSTTGDTVNGTATSFTPTSGKTFRIQSIVVASRGNTTATLQATTFNLRLNTGGAITTSSGILMPYRVATTASGGADQPIAIPIPDGYEISGDGTKQWGITTNSAYTTNAPTLDVTVVGFEY